MSEKWTPEEKEEAIEQVDKMLDSSEVVIRNGGYSYNAEIIELALQRNCALAALKVIVAHEDAAALELKRDLDMPDIELPWMKQAIAAIAACEGKL